MAVFRNRPLALFCSALAVTVLLGWRLDGMLKCLFATLLLLLSALLLCLRWKGKASSGKTEKHFLRGLFLCTLGASVALLSSALFFDVKYEQLRQRNGEECSARGIILCREDAGYKTTLQVRLNELDGKSCSVKAVIECNHISALQLGERFCVKGTLRSFDTDDSYTEESSRLSEGFLTAIVVDDPQDCLWEREGKPDLMCRFRRLNERLSYRLYRSVGEKYGGLSCALLLGNRSYLSGDLSLSFQRAGISHLLALSGLHVSILIAFLDGFLRLLRMPKLGRVFLIPLFSVGYLMLTGCALSTVRAVSMMCILYLGFALSADYDSFTAISVCLAAILVCTPYALLDLSLWFSFLAAGSIIVFSPLLKGLLDTMYRRIHLPKPTWTAVQWSISALFVGVCANLALLLVSAFAFGTISLASVPATLVLIPLTTVLLIASIAPLLLPQVGIIGTVCALLSRWMERISSFFSEKKGILIAVDDTYSLLVLSLMTLTLILCAVLEIKRRGWFLLPVILSVLAVTTSLGVTAFLHDEIAVEYLHENGGDFLVFAKQGRAVAVDFSDGTEAYSIYTAASEHRCTELDDLVLNHYHNKNTVLLSSLSKKILVHRLRLPTPHTDSERAIAKRLEQEAALHGIEVLYYTEDLAIEELNIAVNDYAEPYSGRHEGILFAARVERSTLTYLNVSVMESDLASIATGYAYDAQMLFVGDSGYSKYSVIPVPTNGPHLQNLVLSQEKLLPLCAELEDGVTVTVAPRKYSFLWNEAFSR